MIKYGFDVFRVQCSAVQCSAVQCLNWRQMDQIALRVRTEQIYNNTTSYTIARNCFMFFEKKNFEFFVNKTGDGVSGCVILILRGRLQ
jgi:hypothetical protein